MDGLEILQHESFNAVLMDIQMPDMCGYETTGIIREREKFNGTHIPIIATTAYALLGDREKCIEAGMDDYLEKPICADNFYKVLGKYVNDIDNHYQLS
jgi:CheY-like chemotaxis protein